MDERQLYDILRNKSTNSDSAFDFENLFSTQELTLSNADDVTDQSIDARTTINQQRVNNSWAEQLNEIKAKSSSLFEYFFRLDDHQKIAIFSDHPKTIVSAMVGSGKTTVLIGKILYLHLIKNVPLDEMAVITFTNKAAGEIKMRILSFYKNQDDAILPLLPLFGTFHSVARNILTNSAKLSSIGYLPNFTILDENDRKEFYNHLADEYSLNIKYKNKIGKRIEQARNFLDVKRGSTLFGKMKDTDDILRLLEIGQEIKKLNGVMDFDDLIHYANQILLEPDRELNPQWVVVDEFQDCSKEQLGFIYNLARQNASIFVVGDPNQLIYSWRGSDLSLFYQFRDDGCVEYHLPNNYRSTDSILNAATPFLTYDKKDLQGTRSTGIAVKIRRHYDSNQEAYYLANKISELFSRGVPYQEIAVLFRTKVQSEIFLTVFKHEEIPCEFVFRKTLADVPGLDWFIKLIKVGLNVLDYTSFSSVLYHPEYGIVDKNQYISSMVSFFSEDLGFDQFRDRVENSNILKNKDEVLAFLEKINRFETWLISIKPDKISDIYDYFDLDRHFNPSSTQFYNDTEIAKHFLEKVTEYVQVHFNDSLSVSVLNAVNELSLNGNQIFGDLTTRSDTVKLLTMHAAKGLEFSHVFISGANEGLIPLQTSKNSTHDLEDERRLFYVAMTRAKDYLEISYHEKPEGWGSYAKPSEFLAELTL